MDRYMDGWMDGWVGGWVDGWMDGWMDRHMIDRYRVSKLLKLKLSRFQAYESFNLALKR